MDILGIDIGTVSVKYVRMRGKGNVVSHGEYPHKGGWEDLNFILTDIKDKEGTDVEVAVAVSSQDILKRSFTIPIMPKDEARQAIEWSASKVVNSPLEDMIYETIVLGEVSERGMKKEEVLFIGANKEYINILLSVFETAGFRRIITITDPSTLYLTVAGEKKEGPIAIVDIGGRQTGIYIFDDKRLRLVREILTASESFVDSLMGELGLSYEEAEKQLAEKGLGEESRPILAFPLDRLTAEIQRTFNVYARKYPDRPLAKVYLTGGASKIPNLVPMIQECFIEEVEPLVSPFPVEERLLPAYALGMETEPPVNLLPEKLKAKKKEMSFRSWLRMATLCVIALLLIPTMTMVANLRKVQIAIRSEQADVSSKKEQLRLLGSITSPARYGDLLALKKDVGSRDVTFVTFLKYLSSQLPKDVYVREVEFTDRNKGLVFAGTETTKDTGGGPKESQNTKQAVPGGVKEDTDTAAPAPGRASQPLGQNQGGGLGSEPDYGVTLRGNIFGELDVLESALLNFVISLERSALVKGVEVTKRDVKEIRGKKTLEFVITGKCARHEI